MLTDNTKTKCAKNDTMWNVFVDVVVLFHSLHKQYSESCLLTAAKLNL